MSGVPASNVIRARRENARLSNAEAEARSQETLVVMHDAHERHDTSPCHGNQGNCIRVSQLTYVTPSSIGKQSLTPDFRRKVFQSYVCRHFKHDIRSEEYCEGDVVLVFLHLQVLFQVCESCISNIATVEALVITLQRQNP